MAPARSTCPVHRLISALIAYQRQDGGWGYQLNAGGGPRCQSTSWTEPTALSLLALTGIRSPAADAATARGREWLRSNQCADGGWPPVPTVKQSTWVTSLAVLTLASPESRPSVTSGLSWLMENTAPQVTRIDRFRDWLLGHSQDSSPPGWPWYPDTASWVIPTSFAILALEKASAENAPAALRQRADEGRAFLLARQCAGGGWNHGGTLIRSENSRPYPETTGIALLAMHSQRGERMRPVLELAERLLERSESKEGENWLRLGLAAHGFHRPERFASNSVPITVPGMALDLIARRPTNPFLAEIISGIKQ